MATPRHFTFSYHVAAEFLVGIALAVAPFVFDFDSGATIASVAIGIATATVAISTGVAGHAHTTHHAWDRGLVFVLVVATITTLIVDVGADTAVFAVAAAVEAALLAVTRYSPELR